MSELQRRDFLKASGAGLGVALAGSAAPAGAELPVPPATGRSCRDAAGRRTRLYERLGDLPDRHRPITATKRGEEERDGYALESWVLDLNGLEPVSAFLARPKGLRRPAPAIVFDHSHGGGYDIGKKELVEGRSYMQPTPYAKALTDEGYVTLGIDHWCFGERNHATEMDTFKAMLWQGRVLWGMMVYDSIRALDWLLTRGDVDGSRVATLGMSMGSTMAQWLGALDERVKVTVDICCLTEYHALLADKGLSRHGIYYYVPGLLKEFTASDVNALIAPRAHLGLAGTRDDLTPLAGLDIIDRELKQVYAEAGHPERWELLRYDVGHQETAEGRQAILAFLRANL
ncbi:MAG TPA: alpha/beta hydrolase family protein [Vicinamibacteria bacterium]|nr:alpha/beta hydrolase family protein [Vicinamibacteria bacterium]